jgi:hypothetical protein
MTTHEMIEAIEETNRTWQPLSLPARNKIAKRLDELECELREAQAKLRWFMQNQNQIAMDVIKPVEEENARLREHMTEAWKLVNAMAGQEYWDRAEDWLAENSWAKPSDMV